MEKCKYEFSSKVVEFSEYKTYTTLTTRLCFLGKPNYNHVILPNDEQANDRAQTLVGMPLQAHYVVRDGVGDFSDHCMTKDADGEVHFSTESIGYHEKVWIADDEVETCEGTIETLPCIFAQSRIWNRYPQYLEVAKRLYESGELYSSWEISSFAYEFDNGTKTLTDYVFEANTLLSPSVTPAYGRAAKTFDMSSYSDNELMIASALSDDLISQKQTATGEEDKTRMKDTENTVIEGAAIDPEAPAANTVDEGQKNTDVAELTVEDIARNVCHTFEDTFECDWAYIAFFFPANSTVLIRCEMCEKELEYVRVQYDVDFMTNTVAIMSVDWVELVVAPEEINATVDELNRKIEDSSSAIASLNEKVSEMSAMKEEYDAFVAEKEKAANDAETARVRDIAEKSKLFTNEELESDEFKAMFESHDVAAVNSMIAERVIEANSKPETKETATAVKNIKANLSEVADEDADKKDSPETLVNGIRKYLKK